MNIENFLSINLPSKCLVYEGVKPEDIKIRAYQGRDEVYLSEISPMNLELKFLTILKDLITGVNPEDITIGDFQYIIVWEYAKSYTNNVKISTKCSYCMSEVEAIVDFGELDVIMLPDDFEQPYEKVLPSGRKVNLRLLNISDEIGAQKFEEKNGNGGLFRCAKSMIDSDDVLARIEKLGSSPINDVAAIRAFQEEFYHGPNMNAEYICPKCRREDRVLVPFRFDYIYPRGDELTRYFGKGIST